MEFDENNHDAYVLFQWHAICKLNDTKALKEYFDKEERCVLFDGPFHFVTRGEADAFERGLYYGGIGIRWPVRHVLLRADDPRDTELINICLESKYAGHVFTEEPLGETVNMKFAMEDYDDFNGPFGFCYFHVPMTRKEYEIVKELRECIEAHDWNRNFNTNEDGEDHFIKLISPEIYNRMKKCAEKFVTDHWTSRKGQRYE